MYNISAPLSAPCWPSPREPEVSLCTGVYYEKVEKIGICDKHNSNQFSLQIDPLVWPHTSCGHQGRDTSV